MASCSPRFSLEPLQRLLILGELLGQELQGHVTTERGIFGLVATPMPPPPSFSTMRYREIVLPIMARNLFRCGYLSRYLRASQRGPSKNICLLTPKKGKIVHSNKRG